MRENISGVQARIKESNKTAVYVYCMDHQLNLVVQECITDTVEGENAPEILNFKTTLPYSLGPAKGVSRRFSQQLRKAVGLAVRHV